MPSCCRLPEVPPDTAETNTLMNTESLPQFSQITPASVFRASGKLAILYDTGLSEHDERLSGNNFEASLNVCPLCQAQMERNFPTMPNLFCIYI